MPNYESLSRELTERIIREKNEGTFADFSFDDNSAVRRNPGHDKPNLIRSPFIRDIDKILNCPYYNRYSDKTQVFSLYKNDDITRRGLHVQLVSRIARTIGKALNLNLELIEAIALGHDIGHTPFGHTGEAILDEILHEKSGMRFSHNIHSVRVLDGIFPYNITLQTLNGIAAHDGELELSEYCPRPLSGFDEFDKQIQKCIFDRDEVKKLVPCTLEGCVVRISDIIAYLGKDRQDAEKARLICENEFESGAIGVINAEIINNLMTNIIENSYGKPYIKMDEEHFDALKKAKSDNYTRIYRTETNTAVSGLVKPMMNSMFDALLADLEKGNTESPVYKHHIDYIRSNVHYERAVPYEKTEPHLIVADYIASMTDDYFTELYSYLFPEEENKLSYTGYFS